MTTLSKILFCKIALYCAEFNMRFFYFIINPMYGGFMLTEECVVKSWKQWLLCFVTAGFVTFLFYNPENMKLNLYWFSSVLALSLFAFELVSMVVAILTLLMFYVISGISTPDVVFSVILEVKKEDNGFIVEVKFETKK